MRNLNHWIYNNIQIDFFFASSTFVNFRNRISQFRKNLISLSKICSRCSMRNSKKKVCFKIKKTFFFENSSQNNRELQFISNLQSIKKYRLIKFRKIQNRKVWINTCLRNSFALSSTKICLKNQSIYHIKCFMFFASIRSFQSNFLFFFHIFSSFFDFSFCSRNRFDHFNCKNELH